MNLICIILSLLTTSPATGRTGSLEEDFRNPPDSARPWVYWVWMDGNLSREGISADLEAMKSAGIGGAIIMEVDVGIPRGPVRFMSPQWRELFSHAVTEAVRLGIQITLISGTVREENSLEISVANLWPNRLIGDERRPPDADYGKNGGLLLVPEWIGKKEPRPSTGRFAFSTWRHFTAESPLLPSGLLGPVRLLRSDP